MRVPLSKSLYPAIFVFGILHCGLSDQFLDRVIAVCNAIGSIPVQARSLFVVVVVVVLVKSSFQLQLLRKLR